MTTLRGRRHRVEERALSPDSPPTAAASRETPTNPNTSKHSPNPCTAPTGVLPSVSVSSLHKTHGRPTRVTLVLLPVPGSAHDRPQRRALRRVLPGRGNPAADPRHARRP